MSVFSLQRILPVLLASALACGSVCAQKGLSKEESEELDSLLFRYDLAREEIQQKQWVEPMEKLRSGYREGMQKVQDRFSQTGDLTKALAARVAAKTDPTPATIHPDVKEIAEVQKVFIEAQKKLQTRLDESLVKLASSHVAQLSTIKDGMIKVGRLDSALVVERIVHEFHAETMLLSSATVRSFEDKFGRVMVAELVSHTGMDADTVKIEKGGKKMDVRIDAFSEKDQQFIRDWMKRTPPSSKTARGWTVLFSSDDPTVWNTNTPPNAKNTAVSLDKAPVNLRYLRLKRVDTGEYIIVPIRKEQLKLQVELGSGIYWNGTKRKISNFLKKKHNRFFTTYFLGVYKKEWMGGYKAPFPIIEREGNAHSKGYGGWGFGRVTHAYSDQAYSWNKKHIDTVKFEVAVKSAALTAQERTKLLNTCSQSTGT